MTAMTILPESTLSTSGGERADLSHVRAITKSIRAADRALRQRFPLLRWQSALGVAFLVLAYGAAFGSGALFLSGAIPAWLCIAINAVAISVLREIEHDLIHDLYFPGKRAVQNTLLFLIWPALGNVPNPLYRRKIHLLHHRSSGRDEDLEERLIGNGMRYGALRLLAMLDTGFSTMFRRKELRAIPTYCARTMYASTLPVVALFYLCWTAFLAHHGAALLGFSPPVWLADALRVVDAAAVVWVLPNVLRQASLQVLSSTMHYFADVKGVLQQCQVLSKWYWLPLQAFSCNFGATHAIHHFVVNQPFYLRELVRRDAHAAMRAHGVRFDDVGTFARANRYRLGSPSRR